MGYTTYWRSNASLNPEAMLSALAIMGRIVNDNLDILAGGDGFGEPEVTPNYICFNGKDENDMCHETFSISSSWHGQFGFCKTARKPYDKVVSAYLLVLATLNPDIKVTSDCSTGNIIESTTVFDEQWREGFILAQKYIDIALPKFE